MFTAESRIGEIWANKAARTILLRYIPELEKMEHTAFMYKIMTLPAYADWNRTLDWPEGRLEELMEELKEIKAEAGAVRNGEIVPEVLGDSGCENAGDGSAVADAPEQVEQWGIFELTLNGPADGNPFTDVALKVEFTHGARMKQVMGFYDGDGLFRVRFMPDALGEWAYRIRSSERSLHGIQGVFVCTEASECNHGPVRVRDTYHFAYEDGTPYIPVGTTCYAWTHQGDELERKTLETLSKSPFNKIRMCVFPKSYLFNRNEPVYYPHEGSLETGWDYARFNPAFFRHLEERIADLGRLGIEADLILFHPYDRWGFSEMEPSDDDRYLRYIIARLSAFRNVWWSLANEYDLMWAKKAEDWERYAQIIGEHDPAGHLLSNHNWLNFFDHSRPWVTHCSIQRIDVYKTAEATNEWREKWQKPVVIDECAYEGNIDQGWGNIAGEEMVRRFWEGAVRGGYVGHGETYLNDEEILWWSKGGELTGTSPKRIGFLRKIMEDGPAGGLNPLRSDWDLPCAGIEDEYYLYYFGFNQPLFRFFSMQPGIRYNVDIIDTWNMTVERREGACEGTFRIDLPGRPYMAIRMTRA